jgi:phage antirepressor YoqD-like protein
MIADPVARALKWAEEQKAHRQQVALLEANNARQEQIIGELKPKADYTDMILQNKGLVPITAIAKDYGMSGVAMNEKLHEMKIIYKMGRQWLLYSKYQAKGYTHSETVNFKHKDGRDDVAMNTKWTQKGRLFLYEKLKEQGILPVIERTA